MSADTQQIHLGKLNSSRELIVSMINDNGMNMKMN